MNFLSSNIAAMGGYGFPVFNSSTRGTGRTVTIVGGAVTRGSIVRAATTDAEPLLDAGKAYGEDSWQMVCEKLVIGAVGAYGQSGPFSIVLEDIGDDKKGQVCDFGIVDARLFVPDGGVAALTLWMPDFATANGGRLIPWTATANTKAVAMNVVAIPDPGAAAAEQMHPVLFSGLFPLAVPSNTTS